MRAILLLVAALAGIHSGHTGTTRGKLVFHNRAGATTLALGDMVRTVTGDTIVVERFRYYISNISFTDRRGNTITPEPAYFLVDEENEASKSIPLEIPGGAGSIHFLIGVDSIRNVSGIQTGALDPLQGMFWTWNSGYIMAKLEGTCERVQSAGHRFTYHIGGFRNGNHTAMPVTINLPQGTFSEIHLDADINAWFRGRSVLSVAETPVCHSPGALANRIAENYAAMFTLNSVR